MIEGYSMLFKVIKSINSLSKQLLSTYCMSCISNIELALEQHKV